jgi:hypothetical protein
MNYDILADFLDKSNFDIKQYLQPDNFGSNYHINPSSECDALGHGLIVVNIAAQVRFPLESLILGVKNW